MATVEEAPLGCCLHYAGPGDPRFLTLEDGTGGPNYIALEDFQRLFARRDVTPPRFVFISSYQSERAGDTFVAGGVPHVVCCRQDENMDVKGQASRVFMDQFYSYDHAGPYRTRSLC